MAKKRGKRPRHQLFLERYGEPIKLLLQLLVALLVLITALVK